MHTEYCSNPLLSIPYHRGTGQVKDDLLPTALIYTHLYRILTSIPSLSFDRDFKTLGLAVIFRTVFLSKFHRVIVGIIENSGKTKINFQPPTLKNLIATDSQKTQFMAL